MDLDLFLEISSAFFSKFSLVKTVSYTLDVCFSGNFIHFHLVEACTKQHIIDIVIVYIVVWFTYHSFHKPCYFCYAIPLLHISLVHVNLSWRSCSLGILSLIFLVVSTEILTLTV